MANSVSLFTDDRSLLFAKKPDVEGVPYEYIFLHNDEKEDVKFVACFNLEFSFFKICRLDNLPHSSDLWKNWKVFFTESLEAKKKNQIYNVQINGKTWKRIHIHGIVNNHLFNCFEEFRNNIMNQENKSKNETVIF